MEYAPKEVVLKNGKICVIRRADAEKMVCYQRETSGETPQEPSPMR